MAAVESQALELRRLWASAWDASRSAAKQPLPAPAFELSACAAQLELASEAVARVREALCAGAEVADSQPAGGRSACLLAQLLENGVGLPSPTEDPVGFVQALVRAAFQNEDGGYVLDLADAETLDALVAENCQDLLEAARRLQDPQAAARSLEDATTELSAAVQAALSRDFRQGEAVEFSSKVTQMGREMRDLARRLNEAAAPRANEPEPTSEVETAEPESSAETPESASPARGPASEEEMEEEEEVVDLGEDVAMEDAEGGVEQAERAALLERTKSQVVKRIKVDEVAKAMESRREPIQELRKALSQLDGQARSEASDGGDAARRDRAAEELQQVQRLQQGFRNFGEDLMEGVLALDQLSGLADQDRQVRKDTLKGLQALLDEIDAAKPRIAKMQRRLSSELEELKPAVEAEQQPQPQLQTPATPAGAAMDPRPPVEQRSARGPQASPRGPQPSPRGPQPSPRGAPRLNWERLPLPVKFSSVERPRAYVLSAPVAGLDPESVKLSRREGGVLRVQGARPASEQEQRALLGLLQEHVERLPPAQRQRLTRADAEEMLQELGRGRFGVFQQDFELPRDVDWESVEPSYEDGVLRIVLPRRVQPGHGMLQGRPSAFRRGPNDFFW